MAVNRMPAADVEVSADLVRRLLADQHPDLARLPVEFLANAGQDPGPDPWHQTPSPSPSH